MKKLIYLLILGVLVSGCKKKSDNDDAGSGDNQNNEQGTVVLYLDNHKVLDDTSRVAVYDTTQSVITIEVPPTNNPTGQARLGVAIGNYIPDVGASCDISINPSGNEASLVLVSNTNDINSPDGHIFQHAFAFSGQLKRLSNKKFEATGTVKHYYDPNDQTVYTEMTFKLVFVLKLII